jgi:hypothetical protein
LVKKHDIGVVIWADQRAGAPEDQTIFEQCRNAPARLVFFPDFLKALNQLPDKPSENGSAGAGESGRDPCLDCLARYELLRVETLLAELEHAVQVGDLPLAQAYLQSLRASPKA